MKNTLRAVVAAIVLLGPAAGIAAAADIRDLLLLKQNGLSDEILIQLIQSDGSVFHLKAGDIIDLYKKGLSERVISAMLATARIPALADQASPEPATAPAPLAVTDVPDAPMADRARVDVPPPDQTAPSMSEPPPAPVATTPASSAPPPAPAPSPEVIYVPVPVPVVVEKQHPAPPPAPPAPVYWGYGGQKKPGSWDEPGTPAPTQTGKPTPPGGGRGGL